MQPRAHQLLLTLVVTAMTSGLATPSLAGGYDRHDHRKSYQHGHSKHAPAPVYRNHRRYNSNDDEKLIYGLLVGGLFGYVIGHQNQPVDYSGPAYTPPPVSYRYSNPNVSCLQEREYQMTVLVGGKEAQAYGTACLQPDGSWYRGPAKVVSR